MCETVYKSVVFCLIKLAKAHQFYIVSAFPLLLMFHICNKHIFGWLELHINEIFYWYLYGIQGFSERLVTTSRPAIGLMFKQVGIPYS